MRLRSGRRRLSAARQEGGGGGHQRRGRPQRCTADLISGLPEDILVEILVRLRDTREAARTSVLSRGWRRLWTRLPEMSFDVAAGPGGARFNFDRFMSTNLSIYYAGGDGIKVDAARLTAALRIAAHIAPTKLYLKACHPGHGVPYHPFELPCFEATTSVVLFCCGLNFTLSPAGVFASLEHLDIWDYCCDPCHLLDRCPRLRRLNLSGRWSADGGRYAPPAVRSASLEELLLDGSGNGLHRKRSVDFATPALRKLQWYGAEEVAVLHSMPMVEDVGMCYRLPAPVGFGNKWGLQILRMGSTASPREHEHGPPPPAGRVLSLRIRGDRDSPVERSFAQEMAGLPRALSLSALELDLYTDGHVRGAGALVLEVLMICPPVQTLKLKLVLDGSVPKCSEMCDCDQVSNGTSRQASLTYLEVVQIERFRCRRHEVDLLKLLFRSAPMLKRMTLELAYVHLTVPLDNGQRHELHTIFQANASVECDVYDNLGEKILLA